MTDPFMTFDEPLQLSMLEAWQEKGKRTMKEIEAVIAAPAFFLPGTKELLEQAFQYYGMWYGYWVQYGHRGEVNSGK